MRDTKLPSVFLQRNKLVKKTPGEMVLNTVVFILFALYAAFFLYLLGYIVFSAFITENSYRDIFFDKEFVLELTFDKFFDALKISVSTTTGRDIMLPEMFFNSLWFCLFSVVGGVLMSAFTGYVISKYEFKGRALIYSIVIFCMTIPIIGTTSSLLKLVNSPFLPIGNTPLYVLITSLGGFGFNFMVMHAFFKNVSWSYVEAVLIDGGGHFTAFFKVMLPQATPSLITLSILSLIGSWNDYTTPMMFLPDYPTIASGAYSLNQSANRTADFPLVFAGLLLSFIPVLILFIIFSDRIMKNFSIGGLKG